MNRLAVRATATSLFFLLVLSASSPGTAGGPAQPCPLSKEHGGVEFPVEGLSTEARCLISEVVDDATTQGTTGPVVTPIARPLYEFLLDRPPLTAGLATRLDLAPYECTVTDQKRFWINDHDGTQGQFTFLFRDASSRIYYIDGFHEGHIIPRVTARAVIFLRVNEIRTPEGAPAVESTLITYTKLNDRVLAFLVRLLRPLVTGAVTKKLAKGFDVVNQLGAVAARDPQRFVNEVVASGPNGEADAQALRALLSLTGPPSPVRASSPPKP
jgi:hypothetical protein